MSENWKRSRLSVNKRKPKRPDKNLKFLKNSSYKNWENSPSKTEFIGFIKTTFVSGIIKLLEISRDARLPKMRSNVWSFS